MFYYSHHIGDFVKDTARLNDSQCMAYLRLIWLYYTQQAPLENSIENLSFQIGSDASTVGQLLNHFFTLDGNTWRHSRCDREIDDYESKREKAKVSANARWNNANAMRTHTERNANAPKNDAMSDANREPRTENQLQNTTPPPNGVSESVWQDFLSHRKGKRAKVTATAIAGIQREADKARITLEAALAMCCMRGWTGFKADWLADKGAETPYQRSMREKMEIVAPSIAARAPGAKTIDPNLFFDKPLELNNGT